MFGLGTQELIIILAIGGLLFGAKKLPELGRGLGEAIRGFKKSVAETEEKMLSDQNDSTKSADSAKSTEK
ncbi:MAG: twin-arginine translocase TatA/TatE family subunit [Nitrospiraceae bacterium]|nr:MAG: twin-arginine translocase TatA/TatE family subunit [Nitrospiraceae bacterium]